MGRTKPPLKGESAKKFYGEGGIQQYFSKVATATPTPKKKAGRPKKRRFPNRNKTMGAPPPSPSPKSPPDPSVPTARKSQDNAAATAQTAPDDINDDDESVPPLAPQVLEDSDDEESVSPPPPPARVKVPRINWTVGEHRVLMEKAVHDWLNQKDSAYDATGELISDWRVYANKMSIPPGTFYHYVHPDLEKRRTLYQANRGKKKLLTEHDVKLAGAVLARADRGNDGYSRKEAVDLVLDLNPNMNRAAASKQLSRVVLPQNHADGILKESTVKVQPMTSDRTNINVAQQY